MRQARSSGLGDRFPALRSWPSYWPFLVLLLFLAAWLRFNHVDHAEFQWDQAQFSSCALKLAREGRFSWTGPISSSGIDTFHVAVVLFAVPYSVSLSPVVATAFVAAVNTAAVAGCFLLARRWLTGPGAIVATALFAVAPWAVIYSRKIWPSNLLPPFVLLHVYTGWLAFARGRRWALPVHALISALAVQVHVSAVLLAPVSIIWALLFARRIDWRLVPASALLAALLFVPYLVVDSQQHWTNVRRVAEIVGQPATTSLASWRSTWLNTTGQGLDLLTGADRYRDSLAETPNVRWLFVLEGIAAAAACLLAFWQAARRARRGLDEATEVPLMAAIWLVVPALVLTRSALPPALHYYVVTMPAQFVLVGWLASLLWRQNRVARLPVRILVVLFTACLAAAQAHEIHSILRFAENHYTPSGLGTPLAYEMEAAATAKRLARESYAVEVIVLSEGDEPRQYEMPAVADVLLYGTPHRAVDLRTGLVIPGQRAVYWGAFDTSEVEIVGQLLREVEDARVPLHEGMEPFRFYVWDGGQQELDGMETVGDGGWVWDNGAQLAGYMIEDQLEPGSTARWMLVWHPLATPTEDVYYHWFNHLVGEDGQLYGQADGPSLLPAYWRPGDTVLNWFEIEVASEAPAGDYLMRVGMYSYPSLERISVAEEDGDPAQEWVDVGPIIVRP
jgi:hypothetical protein